MKKLLIASLVLVASIVANAQGTFTMNNSSATRITNALTSMGASVNVAVYYSANTNLIAIQDDSSLVIAANSRTNTLASGQFVGGTRFIPDIAGPGNPAAFQVRAWSGAFTTYEDALAAAQVDGVTLVGKSVIFHMPTLGGGLTAAQSIFGANKLNAFTVAPSVPEPSSIALGLLGLGAIALFRRRK